MTVVQGKFGWMGIYSVGARTLEDGMGAAANLDVNGNLLVTPASGASFGSSTADGATFTQGTTTGGIAMGVYTASPQTLTTGKAGAVALDINRNLLVSLATLLAGEDLTNNRLMTLPKYSYSAVATADVQVKGAPGILHSVTFSCNDAAPTAGSIIIYDSLSETGTQVFNHTFTTTPFMPFTIILDYIMATGIYIGFTTTNDVNVSCAFL